MNNVFVEQALAQLRAQRDEVPHGALRNAYNDACDRLAVLSSKIANPPEKWEDEALAREKTRAAAEVAERRERIATAAMQGYLAAGFGSGSPVTLAQRAVEHADALIAELDKEK